MSLFGGDSPSLSHSSFEIEDISAGDAQLPSSPSFELGDAQQAVDDDDSDTTVSQPDDGLLEDAEHINEVEEENEERLRFQGSDHLWRYHVREELSLAESLVSLRGNDLAAHLYNAHKWKQALRTPETAAAAGIAARKTKWIPKTGDGQKQWYPERTWTEWPLEPTIVPGVHEKHRKKLPKLDRTSPIIQLREELISVASRHVRFEWLERKPESLNSQTFARPRSRPQSRSGSRTPSVPPTDLPDELDEKEAKSAETKEEASRPVICADEDRSEALLQPLVMSSLAKFDELLMALHHNRAGQFAMADDDASLHLRNSSLSRSRSKSVTNAYFRRMSSDRSRDISPAKEQTERPLKRKRTDDDQDEPRGRSTRRSVSVSSSVSSTRGDGPERNPRDWSEVLGLAALISWDPEVIKRVNDRCSDLFGESMTWTAISDPDEPHGVQTDAVHAAKHTDAVYFCPEPECSYHSKGFSRSRGFRFRDHLKRVHKYTADRIQKLVDHSPSPSLGQPSRKRVYNPRGWIPPEPLSCPFQDCKLAMKIFDEPRRLIEHLSRTHKWDPRSASPPQELRSQVESGTKNRHAGDFLVGGVHNDGFLQMI